MADQATQQMVIGASPERTWEVLTDFDDYPTWAHRPEVGRGRRPATTRAAPSRWPSGPRPWAAAPATRLRYDYSQAPEVLAWQLVEGDITRKLDGTYVLAAGRRRRRQHAT